MLDIPSGINIVDYDPIESNFIELFENKLGSRSEWNNLSTRFEKAEIVKAGHEVTNNDTFRSAYRKLISKLPLDFSKPIYFQIQPTFRIGIPNARDVRFHTDDISSGHGRDIINFWVPLTNLNKFNCLHLLSEENTLELKMRFKTKKLSIEEFDKISAKFASPIIINYGQVMCFSNANIHGTLTNKSDQTRLSFDFRVLNGTKESGVKEFDETFESFHPTQKSRIKKVDVTGIVYSNHKVSHISHRAQRTIINEFCAANNMHVLTEGAEWYNLNHYPVLNELMDEFPKRSIIIFSKKAFNLNHAVTRELFKRFESHSGGVYFALENIFPQKKD